MTTPYWLDEPAPVLPHGEGSAAVDVAVVGARQVAARRVQRPAPDCVAGVQHERERVAIDAGGIQRRTGQPRVQFRGQIADEQGIVANRF